MKKAAVFAVLLASLGTAKADSLYPVQQAPSLFADLKARRVGDVLTVLVSEQTQAVAQATTTTARSENGSFGPGTGPLLGQIKRFGLGADSTLDASGQTARNGSLTGRITVAVKSIDANGNLLVEGVREVTINKETQKLTFSGRVRPFDVQPDNTVASAFVADAFVKFEGRGIVADKQREGLLTKIFRVLF